MSYVNTFVSLTKDKKYNWIPVVNMQIDMSYTDEHCVPHFYKSQKLHIGKNNSKPQMQS